jgi:thiosulfate dehydrogenase [quinone] large subunit
MSQGAKISLLILRLSMGWLMLYAGIVKIMNPAWSAAGYLKGASTFSGFYNWLAQPGILQVVNFLNEWGLTLLGISLLVGFLVKVSSWLGAVLMLLYYFPILRFPYPGTHSFIIDDHIIYLFVLIFFAFVGAGNYWGLDQYLKIKLKK